MRGAIFFDENGRTSSEFFYLIEGYIEGRLYYRTFGGYYHHLVIFVIIGWTNSSGISYHKRNAMPYNTCHGIAPIPASSCLLENLSHVELFHNQGRSIALADSF